MRYDLAALTARQRRRRNVTLRPVEPTAALAEALAGPMRGLLYRLQVEALNDVATVYEPRPAMTTDDAADVIGDALNRFGETIRKLVIGINPSVRAWAVRVEEWQRRRFAANVKAGTGVDVVAYLHAPDAESQVRAAIEWASGLIRGTTDDVRKSVESLTWAGFANQKPRREIAKQIAATMQTSRKRAEFIARDQTTKLAASLDGLRQQEAGIVEYRWRHSGKVHFRPEHKAREGQIFRWDTPPADGHPGALPNCGCRAQAFIRVE